MRRTVLRTLVATLLVAALAISTAPMASAYRSVSFPRLTGAAMSRLPTSFRGVFDGPRAGRAFRATGFGGTFRVPASAYHWLFEVTRAGDHFVLLIEGELQLINGDQFHAWRFRLPRGDAAVGPRLQHAHVNTGTALGPFGKIDLTFHSARRLRHLSERCPKTHAVLFESWGRRGTFHGSFDFTPNEGTLPALSLSTIHGGAGRVLLTGAHCPGGGRPQGCAVQTGFAFSDPAQQTVAFGSAGGPFPGANEELSAVNQRRVGLAMEFHAIDAQAVTPVVRLKAPGVVVDASALSPLFSGSLTFESGATTHRRGASCKIATTNEIWASGTLSAAFDSGAVDLTGAGLRAKAVARTKP